MLKISLKRKKKISNKNTRNDHVKWSTCVHAHFFLSSQKITFRSGFVHTYISKYIRYTHRDKLCRKTVVYLPPRYGNSNDSLAKLCTRIERRRIENEHEWWKSHAARPSS